MNVKVAETAGFCFGVDRAVSTVYEECEKQAGPIYTFGPVVHNEIVTSDLEKKGVRVLNSEEEVAALTEGTVIIRAHGVSKAFYDLLEGKGIKYVDATCPFVRKIHKIVKEESEKGRFIMSIFIGRTSAAFLTGYYPALYLTINERFR